MKLTRELAEFWDLCCIAYLDWWAAISRKSFWAGWKARQESDDIRAARLLRGLKSAREWSAPITSSEQLHDVLKGK